jgi:ADP-heptose:LPS heptosyltransferase
VEFHSLQIGSGAEQCAGVSRSIAIIDNSSQIKDFADTAALMMDLDLIISVDTAVAHLAGALGRPVWTLLPFVPDWRWGLSLETTPWYPTMRLFRQPKLGDWESVVHRVAENLQKLVAARNP